MFSQAGKLLTKAGSVSVRAAVSGETPMENTLASSEGSLKAPECLSRNSPSQRPQKEQDHKPEHHCVFSVLPFLSPSSHLFLAFTCFSPFIFLVQRHKNLLCISREIAFFLIHVVYDLGIVIFGYLT